jgi:tRNA dimethylallyltransferase
VVAAEPGRRGLIVDARLKFVAVVGPTATGKTALGLCLADRFGGEVVCADSRTLYRGMDIGTAKPTAAERVRTPHYLLDVLDPGERLSAAAFKQLAEAAIADIWSRGKTPLLVGGSGLYADAVLFDYEFPAEADPERRERLEAMADNELLELLAAEDAVAYEKVDLANRRRVIRAIETAGMAHRRRERVIPQALVLGTMLNKEVVQERVALRIDKMLEEGFIDEVRTIGETYGWESAALDVIGYRAFKGYVLGTKTLDEAKDDFVRGDMALYKKQVTWFKRNSAIQWVEDAAEAEALASKFLDQ